MAGSVTGTALCYAAIKLTYGQATTLRRRNENRSVIKTLVGTVTHAHANHPATHPLKRCHLCQYHRGGHCGCGATYCRQSVLKRRDAANI